MNILIVGHGLAGSLLAWELHRRNVNAVVIDPCTEITSSKVAAGIMLPYTGRRIVKAHKAEIIIHYAVQTFQQIENATRSDFFFNKDVLQLFSSVANRNQWYNVSGETSLFIGKILGKDELPSEIINDFGGITLKGSGFLNTRVFVASMRKWLEAKNCFITGYFDTHALAEGKAMDTAHGTFSHIIFCDGINAMQNPYFNYLPFNPAKGEILDFTCEDLTEDFIINSGIFILPVGDGNFRAGSTYTWNEQNSAITETARKFIENEIRKIINIPFKITGQHAAFRPTTIDRRPFVGFHHEHKNIGIFNGLGTKGAMLAPYYANQLVDFLLNGTLPDADVNIERFREKYFKRADC